MHILEDFLVAVRPVIYETPHEAVRVKWRPADGKNHHENDWKDRKGKEEAVRDSHGILSAAQ